MRTLSNLAAAAAAAAALALSVVTFAPVATAADVKMIAHVTTVDMAADGKSALVKVKNTKGGGDVTVTVTDKATLDKLVAKAIGPGDQVRLSYDDAGGGNLSKTFKKAEGC